MLPLGLQNEGGGDAPGWRQLACPGRSAGAGPVRHLAACVTVHLCEGLTDARAGPDGATQWRPAPRPLPVMTQAP